MKSYELTEINKIYNGSTPLILTIMEEKNVLNLYWPLIKDALIDDKSIEDAVVHGLMTVLSTKCSNNYIGRFSNGDSFLSQISIVVCTFRNHMLAEHFIVI